MAIGATALHVGIGLAWGAVVLVYSWRHGRFAALRAAIITAIVMAAFSAGCDNLRGPDSDCRPAGPGIYNDC